MSPRKVCYWVIPAICCAVWSGVLIAENRAFPTAEGRGRLATGGRNASAIIIQVTTLTDSTATDYCSPGEANGGTQANNWEDASSCTVDANCGGVSGACIEGNLGSFRRAFNSINPRYIIPRVSGEIALSSNIDLTNNSNFTYLGHLAPTDTDAGTNPGGIYLTGGFLRLSTSTDNFIIRHLSIHRSSGDISAFYPGIDTTSAQVDAFTVWNGGSGTNAPDTWIVDSSFFTGGGDETVDIGISYNGTIQNSVIAMSSALPGACSTSTRVSCSSDAHCPGAETCNASLSASAQYGLLVHGGPSAQPDVSLIRNVFFGNAWRSPRVSGGDADIINNLIANTNENEYSSSAGFSDNGVCGIDLYPDANGTAEFQGDSNVIGNYIQAGAECIAGFNGQGGSGAWMRFNNGAGNCSACGIYATDNIGIRYTSFSGVCTESGAGDNRGFACSSSSDCNSTTCTPYICPTSDPCDLGDEYTTSTWATVANSGIHAKGTTPTMASSMFSFDGHIVAASTLPTLLAATGTRKVGPWYPTEGNMLQTVLDHVENEDGDTHFVAWACKAGTTCPDGTPTTGDRWDAGLAGTATTSYAPQDMRIGGTPGGPHPDYTADTYSNWSDDLYTDADVDGIPDSWEATHCGGACDPNSTTDCDNSNWIINMSFSGDTTVYPCVELYAYELLGEVTAPPSGGVEGASLSGVTVGQ